MVVVECWGGRWVMYRLWRVGLFDFGSGSGRVWPKSSGFGSGSGIGCTWLYWAVLVLDCTGRYWAVVGLVWWVQVFSTAARWAVLCGPIGVVEASRGPIPPSIQNCQGGLPNTSCLIQIWAGLLRGRQCGHPQEGQIEPGEGGGSRGCQVQPKVAEGHGLYEKVICLDCLIWLHRR